MESYLKDERDYCVIDVQSQIKSGDELKRVICEITDAVMRWGLMRGYHGQDFAGNINREVGKAVDNYERGKNEKY